MNALFAVLILVAAGVAVLSYLKYIDNRANFKASLSSMTNDAKTLTIAKIGAVNIKNQHVAAITAAVLAATRGRGRILNIVPQAGPAPSISSDATKRWRATGIAASVGRRLAPSWKR